jgi:transposase
MWFSEPDTKIFLYTQPADMRKSFNGLSALVKQKLQENPLSGHYFVFINRKKTQTKILYFDRSGYCIWGKRLEQGQFNIGKVSDDKILIDGTRLKMILEGLQARKIRQYKRYKLPDKSA